MFTRILIPVDGSKLAEKAITPAMKLAHEFDCEVVLLRVATSAPLQLSSLITGWADAADLYLALAQQANNAANSYLSILKDSLQYARIETEFVTINSGQVAEAIIDQAKAQACDLIVMSTHGRSGVQRWLLGSVAEHVLRHSATPVLLIPVTEKR